MSLPKISIIFTHPRDSLTHFTLFINKKCYLRSLNGTNEQQNAVVTMVLGRTLDYLSLGLRCGASRSACPAVCSAPALLKPASRPAVDCPNLIYYFAAGRMSALYTVQQQNLYHTILTQTLWKQAHLLFKVFGTTKSTSAISSV
jgi:hypothetical protein